MPAPRSRRLARAVEHWFSEHQRALPWRSAYDPYHVWVSEVMLQQTRMEVVLGYFQKFLERFPTIDALARASEHDVMAAWSGLGYYRRARMLREGAIDVAERFGGRIPENVDELLTIRGIGRYTAGAIASIAHDRRAAIVDGNVARVASRIEAIEEPLGSTALANAAWSFSESLVAAAESPRMLNQGLMELGALICTPRNPQCLVCPAAKDCRTRSDALPLPKAKKATRRLHIPLYVVTDARGRVLMRRQRGQLMDAMYHLPHGNESLLAGTPIAVDEHELLGTFKHTVTTRHIEFRVYAATVTQRADGWEWIDPRTIGDVPHPSYVRKALRIAGSV